MQRREVYLAKAKEAEEQAEKATDDANKASWLRIAAGYDDLAARQMDQKIGAKSS